MDAQHALGYQRDKLVYTALLFSTTQEEIIHLQLYLWHAAASVIQSSQVPSCSRRTASYRLKKIGSNVQRLKMKWKFDFSKRMPLISISHFTNGISIWSMSDFRIQYKTYVRPHMVTSHGHPGSREGAATSNQLCLQVEEQNLPTETNYSGYSFFGTSS